MVLVADALADRAGLPRGDLAVRTVAGAAMGVLMASVAAMADDPVADLPSLIDRTLGLLERGLPVPDS
jgi:hypothetical protein